MSVQFIDGAVELEEFERGDDHGGDPEFIDGAVELEEFERGDDHGGDPENMSAESAMAPIGADNPLDDVVLARLSVSRSPAAAYRCYQFPTLP